MALKKNSWVALTVLITFLAAFALLSRGNRTPAPTSGKTRAAARIPGRYIVVYRPSVTDVKGKTDQLERARGFEAARRYSRALRGFAAALTDGQVRALRQDPDVAFVAPDRPVRALGSVPLATGDSAPTGVRRIEAATQTTTHEASGAGVAVIDTGIDLGHADLNPVHGVNCVGSGPADDDNGHGTHVAGTIAARNNGSGVTGVAPGTKVYAAKVLDAKGSGSFSTIICAIDWVTGTRTDGDAANDIAVANMSLGGVGDPVASCDTTTDPLHRAICNSTSAGVTYVVAAGNDGWDFDHQPAPNVPAAYPQVLTVTAMSDSDGAAGGSGGSPDCALSQKDDSYATFSNYAATSGGEAHAVAAPGVCIRSTWLNGGYDRISGTSMATPHVAGAVALCLREGGSAGPCAGLSPGEIIQRMRRQAQDRTISNAGYGFAGDPTRPVSGRYFGYLTWVGVENATAADTTAPSVTSVSPADGASGVPATTKVSVTFSEPMDTAATQGAFSLVSSGDGSPVAGSFSWSGETMTFTPSTTLSEGASYTAKVSVQAKDAAGNALSSEKVWTFTTAATATNVTAAPVGTKIQAGSLRAGDASRLGADDNSYYEVNSTTKSTRVTSWFARFTSVPNELRSLSIAYSGKNSRSCTQTIWVWRWTTKSWVKIDSRSVGTTEVRVDSAPGGTLADYVSGTSGGGELRVRVRCATTSGTFFASGDLAAITYGTA